jgi:hypothetical protein
MIPSSNSALKQQDGLAGRQCSLNDDQAESLMFWLGASRADLAGLSRKTLAQRLNMGEGTLSLALKSMALGESWTRTPTAIRSRIKLLGRIEAVCLTEIDGTERNTSRGAVADYLRVALDGLQDREVRETYEKLLSESVALPADLFDRLARYAPRTATEALAQASSLLSAIQYFIDSFPEKSREKSVDINDRRNLPATGFLTRVNLSNSPQSGTGMVEYLLACAFTVASFPIEGGVRQGIPVAADLVEAIQSLRKGDENLLPAGLPDAIEALDRFIFDSAIGFRAIKLVSYLLRKNSATELRELKIEPLVVRIVENESVDVFPEQCLVVDLLAACPSEWSWVAPELLRRTGSISLPERHRAYAATVILENGHYGTLGSRKFGRALGKKAPGEQISESSAQLYTSLLRQGLKNRKLKTSLNHDELLCPSVGRPGLPIQEVINFIYAHPVLHEPLLFPDKATRWERHLLANRYISEWKSGRRIHENKLNYRLRHSGDTFAYLLSTAILTTDERRRQKACDALDVVGARELATALFVDFANFSDPTSAAHQNCCAALSHTMCHTFLGPVKDLLLRNEISTVSKTLLLLGLGDSYVRGMRPEPFSSNLAEGVSVAQVLEIFVHSDEVQLQRAAVYSLALLRLNQKPDLGCSVEVFQEVVGRADIKQKHLALWGLNRLAHYVALERNRGQQSETKEETDVPEGLPVPQWPSFQLPFEHGQRRRAGDFSG